MNTIPVDTSALAGQAAQPGSVLMNPQTASIKLVQAPLKAGPIPRDPSLPLDHPDQTFTDCRSIEGWTSTIYRLMQAAWGLKDGDDSFRFGKSYGLLPGDAKDMKGVIIVYEILSMVPGSRGKNGRELKPLLREVVPMPVTTASSTSDVDTTSTIVVAEENPSSSGRTWVWAQRLDAVVRFMIYGDTWERADEYCEKTFDLIQTYTGIFKQAGLAKIFFRQQGQDVLHDPPRVQEFPNKCLLYDVTVERQTRASYAQIEQVVVRAGIINPVAQIETTQLIETVEGVPESPILPSSSAS